MTPRQTLSLDELKDLLLGQITQVVYHYAPPAKGSHEAKGQYFTLNPGRADKSVGSFCVHMTGEKAGKWNDYATGAHGDILDLIALNLGCSISDAVREARSYLGLQSASPADLARRQAAAERARNNRVKAAEDAAKKRDSHRRSAHRLWLSSREQIAGTPVEFYLRDRRCIDLAPLGRQPGALRYLDRCFYTHMDPETGEVIEAHFPAMVAVVQDHHGKVLACHRTYLAIAQDGIWDKAPVPAPKKVLGDYAGGWINIWTGTGPRGGKAGSLNDCPPGTTVYVAEGIEDALSGVVELPEARFIAGISLSNLAGLKLPPNVAEIVLIADRDDGPQQQLALQNAVAQHRAAGRRVRRWDPPEGCKDLNDALRLRARAERGKL